MRNKKAPQTVSARHDAREHLSIEAYHKLNRASAVSQFVGGDLIHRELSGLHQLYIPHIFSYLNEDIDFVLNELKAKGLCRDFLAQQKDRETGRMFDFPQPGEIYRSAGFPDVAVVGILEDGIPWEMPYRCPDIVWNPYRRKFSILVRILADGRTTDIPLGRFLREFTCDRPDLFKRSPVNRHAVLKEMAGDPELQKWREKYLDIYPQDTVPVSRAAPVAREWREIPRTEPDPETTPDNSYRNYL